MQPLTSLTQPWAPFATVLRVVGLCWLSAVCCPFPSVVGQVVEQPTAVVEETLPVAEMMEPVDDQVPCFLLPSEISYDQTLPSPQQFLGYEVGEFHIRHHELVGYLTALSRVSDRVSLETIGKTHGGRPLVMLTITSPENQARIEEIRLAHRSLTKPALAEYVEIDDLPAVINMGYSVHGDESSGANAVPAVAYYLAAGQGAAIDELLENVVILLDPCLNPDGFDRFAAWANAGRGRHLNGDPNHWEHTQPWPGGRVHYYWFDLNRDWLPGQHPESQARLRKFHQWKPNVLLDFHEMGTSSTFFFQPGVPKRTHPLTPERTVDLTKQIGSYHADALDQIGSLYFTEEQFDDFYMGKGSTYPDLHGAIGILFEQASSRGHLQESRNGILTFDETIRNQFTCSLSSLQATLEMREALLESQREFYRQAMARGSSYETKAFAFQAPGDLSRLLSFGQILRRHDIDCYWVNSDQHHAESEAGDAEVVPAGITLVVPTAQPEFLFLLALIERRTEFTENVFYDVSTWTLPLAFDLDSYSITTGLESIELIAFDDLTVAPPEAETDAAVIAYAIPWTNYDAPRTLAALLEDGINVRVAQRRFVAQLSNGEQEFGHGTLLVHLGSQEHEREKVMNALIDSAPARLYPIVSGLTPVGIDLGSNRFPPIEKPEVMLLVDQGVSRYEAGEVWHLFDTRVEMPITLLSTSRFGSTDLSRYQVIVMVGGSYSMDERELGKLRDWISAGGTLIATTSAVSWASRNDLVDVEFRELEKQESDAQLPYESARETRALDLISGAIFETLVDRTHPLGYGLSDERLPVFRNNRVIMSPGENPFANPVMYLDEPLLSGYVSDANLDLLRGSASVRVESLGRGRIVLMAEDPNFRAFFYGTNRLFLNAVFFGQFINTP